MNQHRRFGDRKDGVLLRDLDSMHFICPLLYPNRCDNEAFISETIDLTPVESYLARRNADHPEYRYNTFQIIVAALLRTITLRPKMNRFIANKNMYQRREVCASFVVKKQFADNGDEGLAFIHAADTDTLDTIHDEIYRQIMDVRGDGQGDASTESMDLFNKMPRFLSKAIVSFICFLDRHGWVPQSLIATDPYYSSVVISNLGSIRLHAGYHHLTNWGTCSMFCVIGEIKKRPFPEDNGSVTMRTSVDLGLTVDERIADGYYYAGTVRLLRRLLQEPELLEQPLNREVEY